MIKRLFNSMYPHASLWLMLGSILTLAAAYVFQYGFHYAPCDLCYLQRYPYMVTAALGAIFLVLEGNKENFRFSSLGMAILGLMIIALFYDAGVAIYHVGVEQKWWQGPSECSSTIDMTLTGEALLEAIMNAPLVKCDEVQWSLFGVSMAGYNAIIALSLASFGTASFLKNMADKKSA